MFTSRIYSALFLFLSLSIYAQSPYGRVLTLDNTGTQQWIDIGTVLSSYSTYHPGTSSPAWLTTGNALSIGDFFGSTNNMPLIFKVNGTEIMRADVDNTVKVSGNLRFSGALMPNGSAGTSGQVLVSQGSGNPPVWQSSTYTETDPIYKGEIDVTGSSNNQILRYNGTKYTPTTTGNLTTSTTGVTISGGTNAVIGSGTTIDIATANGITTGLLTNTDWTTFNNKIGSGTTASGDLSGTFGSPTVAKIQGRDVSSTAPSNGQVLTWNNTSSQWEPQTASGSDWSLSGNSLAGTEKFGSTNNQPVTIITNNTDRIRITTKGQIEVLNSARSVFLGEGAGANQDNRANRYNNFIGYQAGYSNTTGTENTANGYQALYSNHDGSFNTATGYKALYNNTEGCYNTAIGHSALYSNTTGSYNIAVGIEALYSNTEGDFNIAIGLVALSQNTTGNANTATGSEALYSNTTGYENTATGSEALYSNTEGNYNTASGNKALYYNINGIRNTATGYGALWSNTTGTANTATGYYALYNSIGDQNTALGLYAGINITEGSNNICIGYNAQASSATVDNEVTIGNSNNDSYRMYAASWTNASDARYKHDIKDLPYGLDFILKLRPRQYVYNNSTDGKITMGFVAQEVQDVMKQYGMVDRYNLVKIMEKDFLGLNTTEIIPILTKAIQEQQGQINSLQKENEELKAKLQSETEALKAENEQMRKRLELLERLVLEGTSQPETLGAK